MPGTVNNSRPVYPGELLLKQQSGEGKRNLLVQEQALALGRGSSKEESREKILGPALPSEFKPSDPQHWCHAFRVYNMKAFH